MMIEYAHVMQPNYTNIKSARLERTISFARNCGARDKELLRLFCINVDILSSASPHNDGVMEENFPPNWKTYSQ